MIESTSPLSPGGIKTTFSSIFCTYKQITKTSPNTPSVEIRVEKYAESDLRRNAEQNTKKNARCVYRYPLRERTATRHAGLTIENETLALAPRVCTRTNRIVCRKQSINRATLAGVTPTQQAGRTKHNTSTLRSQNLSWS